LGLKREASGDDGGGGGGGIVRILKRKDFEDHW
jgi:hypothetical protein